MSETVQNLSVQEQVADLNAKLQKYQELSGKMWDTVLKKQGAKLGYALNQQLRGIAPARGQVRAEALARLKAGGGIKIRERVNRAIILKYGARSVIATRKVIFGKKGVGSVLRKGKRLNLQALMAQREINTRESGRGFLGVSARYPRELAKTNSALSKYGPVLSRAGVSVVGTEGEARFVWDSGDGELATSAASGLEKGKGQAAIARALRDTADDIQVYITRKLEERGEEAGLK